MSDSGDGLDQHLLSEYVFIDSEVYVRCGFDFSGSLLGKLAEFAQAGMLRVLITDVTRREVLRTMRQRVEEVFKACRRDWRILQQAGVALGRLLSLEEALHASEIALDDFLKATRSLVVPLKINIELLLDDYFNLRPPTIQ